MEPSLDYPRMLRRNAVAAAIFTLLLAVLQRLRLYTPLDPAGLVASAGIFFVGMCLWDVLEVRVQAWWARRRQGRGPA